MKNIHEGFTFNTGSYDHQSVIWNDEKGNV